MFEAFYRMSPRPPQHTAAECPGIKTARLSPGCSRKCLYCTVLYCTVLYCTVLHCTVLHCTYCTVLYCTVLYCTALHCTVPYPTPNCPLPSHACLSCSSGVQRLIIIDEADKSVDGIITIGDIVHFMFRFYQDPTAEAVPPGETLPDLAPAESSGSGDPQH